MEVSLTQTALIMACADAYANHRMIDGAQDVEASQQSRNTRDALHAAVDAMAQELEAAKRDAERFNHLLNYGSPEFWQRCGKMNAYDDVVAAIDAARKEQP
jgi:hypothetical protein